MNREALERIRTALAAMLCAGDPHCPTEREARQLCVAVMQELNRELNTELNTNMKQDTDCLIETLRLKKSEALFYKTAADRLEELQRELDGLRRVATRPEPSRLEIAAMLLAALAGRESETWEGKIESIWAIKQADELIATSKEMK